MATPPSISDDTFQAGSRLKPRVLKVGDQSLFDMWHDSQRGEDCLPRVASDGLLRCLPYFAGSALVGYFHDAACTQPAFTASGTPAVVLQFESVACVSRARVFSAGARVAAGTLFYKTTSGCTAAWVDPARSVFAIGAEIPSSEFVGASLSASSGSGVGFDRLQYEDGASATWVLRNGGAGQNCYPSLSADGSTRCLPWSLMMAREFANASCTQPALVVNACVTPEYAIVGAQDTGTCTPAWTLANIGAPLTSYFAQGSMCEPETVLADEKAYSVGATVSPTQLPSAAVSLVGSGRLQPQVATWESGVRSRVVTIDTQFGEPCVWLAKASDTDRTCVVSTPGVYLASYFSDPGCSQQLAYAQAPAASCAPQHVATWNDAFDFHVYAVGSRFSGTVYAGAPGNCTALSSPPQGLILFRVGAELDPSQLAHVPQSVE